MEQLRFIKSCKGEVYPTNNREQNIFKKKKVLFRSLIAGLSIIIGFLYGFQHLLWLNEIHWDYNNAIFIPSFRTPDAYHYIAQIKEVYEGNYLLSNTYLAEYKNVEKSPWPVFPYYLTVFIGKIFHLKVQYVIVLMDFILPPVTFLVAYLFLSTISGVRRTSLLGAFILTLSPHILWFESLLSTGLRLFFVGPPILADAHCYHCFSRPINPQLTYPFLLASLLFFFKGIKTLKHRYFILSVLFGIFTSYSYVYFSSYLYVFLGLVAIGSFVLREWGYFKSSFVVLGIILISSIPFWYSVFSASDHGLQQMTWMTRSHIPIIDVQLLLTFPLCVFIVNLLLRGKIHKLTGLTSLSLLLSGVICLNQHVITGINTQPEWHYNMFVRPQSVLLAVMLLLAEFRKNRNGQKSRNSRRIKRFPIEFGVFCIGICLVSISALFTPSFVASQFSPDGSLSPKLTLLLEIFHIYGFAIGLGLLTLGVLLKTRLNSFVKKWVLLIFCFLRRTYQFLHMHIRLGLITSILIIVLTIWDIAIAQYAYYQNYVRPHFGDLQELSRALNWLNEHTEKETVILGSLDYAFSGVITIYTNNNLYLASHAQFYTVPPLAELQDRLYNLMYFSGITTQKDFAQFIYGKNPNHVFVEHLRASFDKYQEKLRKDLYSELKKYRVDYLFYGPREQKNFKVDPETTYTFLRKVYDDGIVKIYQII